MRHLWCCVAHFIWSITIWYMPISILHSKFQLGDWPIRRRYFLCTNEILCAWFWLINNSSKKHCILVCMLGSINFPLIYLHEISDSILKWQEPPLVDIPCNLLEKWIYFIISLDAVELKLERYKKNHSIFSKIIPKHNLIRFKLRRFSHCLGVR